MSKLSLMEQALKYLKRQPLTEKKLADKLIKDGFETAEIDECLKRIREWNYVNDREYGINQIRILVSKLKSRLYVEDYLLNAGVERDLAGQLLEQFYPECLEVSIAQKLIQQKFAGRSVDLDKKGQYLLRTGFSENTVGQCVSHISTT